MSRNGAKSERTSVDSDSGEGLSLWLAYPDDLLTAESGDEWTEVLTGDERARMQAFRFDRHRREYLATRILVHRVVSHLWPLQGTAWQFVRNEYGKPSIEPECGLRFNLANSVGMVVCLAGFAGEVGVDVEPHERAGAILELAAEVFSQQELAQLQKLSQEGKLDRALSLWTLKEAYIKARGVGLSLPLKEISFLFDDAKGIRLELGAGVEDEAARWTFCVVDRAEHRVALMSERTILMKVEIREFRPLGAPPELLHGTAPEWFPRS